MSIQIIDGFQVNTARPIDNRIVASGSSARNAIPYKYEGLRVFDTFDSIPYVYLNNAWITENTTGIAGSGNSGRIPIYVSATVISDSSLYQSGSFINTTDVGGGANLISMDTMSGNLIIQGNLNVNGLSGINAGQIKSGLLTLNRLTNGSSGWILTGSATAPTYINPTQVTVGTASISQKSVVSPTTTNIDYNLTLVAPGAWSVTPGSEFLHSNAISTAAGGIKYNPSTNQLKIGLGASASPSLSFIGDTNTGIYSPGANSISVAVDGGEKVRVATTSITFGEQISYYPRISIKSISTPTEPSYSWWGNDQTGIFRPANNNVAVSTDGVERMRISNKGTSIGIGTPIRAMYVGRINFTKTGTTTGVVTVVYPTTDAGNDFIGPSGITSATNYTITDTTANATTVRARINFPTPMPSANIVVVCHIDSTSSNHYTWTAICAGRTTTYIDLVCLQQDAAPWISGSVGASFVAYCVN